VLRILDLYSGIGGFSKAFEDVSSDHFKTHAFCEIDKYAQLVLKKHWPLTPIFEDVRTIPGKMFRHRIEIICGGFPCQDISVAGKQRGINEETRSGLWFEYKRLIEEIKPRWVVIENVANLRSNGLDIVLKDLCEIGYDCEWQIISARSVGAPHLRERIWIVAWPSKDNTIPNVKPIPNLQGYFCDPDGNFYSSVRSHLKPIKTKQHKSGYVDLELSIGGRKQYFKAHRLIASTFLDLDLNSNLQVNHKNMIKNDNRVSNLEIVTAKENIGHSISCRKHKFSKIEHQIKCIDTGEIFSSIKEASDKLNIANGEISRQLTGKSKTTKGYKFERIGTKITTLPIRENDERIYKGDSGDYGHSKPKPTTIPHPDHFRFWPTFTTEEEKQFWWAEATTKFCNWWETEPDICRVDDGLSKELDKVRSQRIKQLGNSIVPPIVEVIAKRILELELEAK